MALPAEHFTWKDRGDKDNAKQYSGGSGQWQRKCGKGPAGRLLRGGFYNANVIWLKI
jgi:hypothetical protein